GLLERGLVLAAHFDQGKHVEALVAHFQELLRAQRGSRNVQALDTLAGHCFRGLRKFGLRDSIDGLLRLMADVVLEGQDLASLRPRLEGDDEAARLLRQQWPATLRTLLQLASGWFYFGKEDQAKPVLDEACRLLFGGKLEGREPTKLAC